MRITGVLLAAGTSSRMGSQNKLLLEYRGSTVIEVTLRHLAESKVDDIVIVCGYEKARIERALAGRLTSGMQLLYNRRYRFGRAESIKCAVRRIKGRADAALFMVADKPDVSTALIDRAIGRYRKDRPAILYVETPAGRGHPIIFSKAVFRELLRLHGDCVGNELVEKYKDGAVRLKDRAAQVDIDDEADYRKLTPRVAGGNRR
jgi:molybdenum cofactor cytidylyltransferase